MAVINGGYREYKLENGLVVALQKTPTQTIAAKLRVNYGPSHERDGEEGLAHYLEHCLSTGGSEKYSPVAADEIRESFGESNASTTIGRTLFEAQMLSEDLGLWLEYISDHVLKPRFDEERIDGERKRVLREISDQKSNQVHEASMEFSRAFYRGHPKERFILGKEEVIRNATREVLRGFHKKGYHPNNIDLFIVGNLPDDVEELVRKYFSQAPRGENTRIKFPRLKPLTEKVIIRRPAPDKLIADSPEDSSARIFLQYSGPVNGDDDEYAVRTMNHILGGSTDSLLFQNLGLKMGLGYDVRTTGDGNYNAGESGIYATVPARRIDEAVDAIFAEINRMKTQMPSETSLKRIKKVVKYTVAKAFDSNEGHIDAIEARLDKGINMDLIIEGFGRVTPERVMEVSRKYLPDKETGKYVLYIRDPFLK
jgi:predicted Zn-dependent peptidase